MTPAQNMRGPVAPFDNDQGGATEIYTVDFGDGTVGEVEGPKGATAEQLQAFIQQNGGQQSTAPAETPSEVQFGDDPNHVASRMLPEDEARVTELLQNGNDAGAAAYAHSKGFSLANADAIKAARDKTGRVSADNVYQLPRAADEGAGMAFVRGAGQGMSFGLTDELHGLGAGTMAALRGGSFSDAYDRTVDYDRAQLGGDFQDHAFASVGGNLAGGLALPLALEKAGITTATRAVGNAARDAALAEGLSPSAANRIAARAVAHRLGAEGGAYGGAYGVGSSEGGPGERLLGGVEGAATGAVLGGLVIPGVNAAGGRLARGARSIYDRVTGSVTKVGAERQASRILTDSALRPVEDIIDDIAARAEAVPGSSPTLAEVAGDSGIAGLQRGMANSNPAASGPISERLAQNAMARTAYADEALGAGNPQAIQDFAASRVGAAESATATQRAERAAAAEARLAAGRQSSREALGTAEQGVASGAGAVGPTVDRTATGAATREAFSEAYGAARARTREAYNDPALTTPQPVNIPKSVFDNIVASAHDFYGDAGGEMPAAMQAIIGDLAGDPANTRVLTNIDRRLADVAGSARMAGKRSEAAFAEQVRATLGGYVEQNAPKAYRDALANAKQLRAEQGRVFETGDAPRAFAKDRYGNPVVGDTTVPSRLVRPGAPGGDTADGLIAAIGPEAAERAMRQELRRVLDESGVITEAKAQSIATRYGEAAKRFPALQSDLTNMVSHAARRDAAASGVSEADRAVLTAAEKAHVNELSAAETAIKASPLSRVADMGTDPASFVGHLLGRSDGGRMLRRLASDVASNPEAVAGLRRSFGQYLVEAGAGVRNTAAGDDIPALAKTRKAISTIISRAGDLLTPQQKMALQRVGAELKATNFAMNAGRPSGSDTAQNQAYQSALHFLPLPAEARAMKAVYSAVMSKFSNREQVQHLLVQAVLDPDFAATLLKRPTAAHLQSARATLLGAKAVSSSTVISQPATAALTDKAIGR